MKLGQACVSLVVGATLLALSLADSLPSPYSIFAVLVGSGLIVDGVRKVIELRRLQQSERPQS
ncbi:hypothetical protein [Streptomyces sp. NPDC048659]|uniref:hypothetical protein n=1 Tax=Streptomyces sp. NPDC048659 TaxID=3155489 RepID=UPI00343BC9D8